MSELNRKREREEHSEPIRVAVVWDFDLTCTEEYQQIPLIRKYLSKYIEYYNEPSRLERIKKYNEKFDRFTKPEDFFGILVANRNEVLAKDPKSRIQNGISWMGQLVRDMQKGGPLEGVTEKEMKELGKEIKLSPGIRECFRELKKQWKEKGVELYNYIVSVGIRDMIEGAFNGDVDGIFACEMVDVVITSIIEDYSKTELGYEISKGNKELRDAKFRGKDYKIPFERFVVLGDGFSDIASFRFYRKKGAKCVLVYQSDNLDDYHKIMKIAHQEVDYVLERFYVPDSRNSTWRYLNDAVSQVVFKTCDHSEESIHRYRWSKKLCTSEIREIEEHFRNCIEHEPGLRLTHVVPKKKEWYKN